MPRKKTDETALVPGGNLPILPPKLLDELANMNCLADLDAEDKPLPFYAANMKYQLPDGRWIPKDVFFNVATEEVVGNSVDAVLLTIKKHRRHTTYAEGVGTTLHCRSFDLKEGVTQDGEVIECATCPHKAWINNAKPACSLCYAVVGLNLADMSPFVVRIKGASLQPARKYFARYFTGKLRKRDGTFGDLPLFVFKTRLSLETPEGTYAVIRMENLGPCTEAEIIGYRALYQHFIDFRRVDLDAEQPSTENGSGRTDDDQIPDFPAP